MLAAIGASTISSRSGLGYLLGSIPFGLLLTRPPASATCATSARAISAPPMCCAPATRGSRPLTLMLDALKGTAAVLDRRAASARIAAILGGLGAFLGHLFPVWLGFRGGKGVATYIGVLLGLYWPGAIAFCVTWLVVAAVARYSSLAALSASAGRPCSTTCDGWAGPGIALLFLMFTMLLLLARTHANIGRPRWRGEQDWRARIVAPEGPDALGDARPRSECCCSLPAVVDRGNAHGTSVPGLHRASLLAPRRQYRTPAAGRGGTHWREELTPGLRVQRHALRSS